MKKLLVANRGEIAIRVIRAAQDLSIGAVAIYAEDDKASLHVRKADWAVPLEGKGARAYLDIDQIVKCAVENNCDAIHPGYGFLSENANFAVAVEGAGLIFVGPSVAALQAFGDKSAARKLAEKNGLPVLVGLSKNVSLEEAHSFFAQHNGQPVILKAIAGGGGRGMRVVAALSDLDDAYERCASEAMGAFGRGELYIERFVNNAKHIEVQIVGDGCGQVSHIWERECSVQRRHQKLIEIAPSPGLDEQVRKQVCELAVKLGESVNYKGLGTIEFLLDTDTQAYYFMEANARLQVEHTVTEEITGIDLVRAQIEIANGATLQELGLSQHEIPSPQGYAMQLRVNMESMDAQGNVKPAGGRLTVFEVPTGPGVRVDTYGFVGYVTNPNYDSLLAKVIVSSRTHNFIDVTRRAQRALKDFSVQGVATNIDFLQQLLGHTSFISNQITTRFVDTHVAELVVQPNVTGSQINADLAGSRVNARDPLAVLEHGKSGVAGGLTAVQSLGLVEENLADENLLPGSVAVRAPMQGTVVSFEVQPGDEVYVGKLVVVMEAMKMEHEITADISGIVEQLRVEVGDTVFAGHALIVLVEEAVEVRDEGVTEELDLDFIRPDLQEVFDRKAAGYDENRPKAVAKRRNTGHRTARENVADLCDEGTFVEYGGVVIAGQRRRRSVEDLIENTTGDGMVCGLGQVNGALFPESKARTMIMSYDYMVLAGTQGMKNHAKKDRLFEVAEQYRLPTVLFAEGGGGRPGDTDGSGVAGLDCWAFTYFARLSGLVPLVGITTGRCFAGNAVLLGCCDVIIATRGSNIGIGGPAMIEGGGLGVFKPEEVGPMEVQVPNGVVDIVAIDEQDAVAKAKQYLSYFQGPVERWQAPDERALRFIVPENRLRYYDMREVIKGIADVDSILELRSEWAIGIITAFIRIEGRPMGVIANNPVHLSGAIDAPGADKGTRFMQLCDAFDIPILSLCDCPGIMVGPEVEKTAVVRHAARMFVTSANIDVPLMTIVIRKGYGLGAQAMAGGSFKAPLFTITWPTGEFGGMGLEGAVKLGYRKELQAIEDPQERTRTYEEMVANMYQRGKAVNMASHFELDDVIDPADSRKWIVSGLRCVPAALARKGKKRPNIDTW